MREDTTVGGVMADRSSAGNIAVGVLGVGLGAALIIVTAFRLRSRTDAQTTPPGPKPEEPEAVPPAPSSPPKSGPSKTPSPQPPPAPPKVLKGPCALELFRP